ncbi:MAG: hypothetical protein US74_C0015G0032 [Parcubacteria group bacterium GW2011_GWA2_38_13]|nr:MAG: hypothetical protein US74_C0015G0032 [Parcubacteria group bacterium GW2011_GWA2_38_13]
MIFWGPPGSGKTTLAWVIAKMTKSTFVQFSAVSSGVKEFREVIEQAENRRKSYNKRTILFIDEIHRWNKAQQDGLLPHVEKGVVTLIGATTENPSFEINSALLSRSRVFVLEQLSIHSIEKILRQALENKEKGLGNIKIKMDDEAILYLSEFSNGDARTALNALEFAVKSTPLSPALPHKGGRENDIKKKSSQKEILSPRERGRGEGEKRKVSSPLGGLPAGRQGEDVLSANRGTGEGEQRIIIEKSKIKEALQKTHLYDRQGEEHYNIISALHKSVRGGNADAALYWLGRMLESGEDPLYVARRLIRMAVEDIGLANPTALVEAVACYHACHFMGMPECDVVLAQCVAYLAKSKKSVEVYQAYGQVKQDVKETMDEPVPLHLRNAPTKLMKEVGYGKDYKYSPDYEWKEDQQYFPDKLKGRKYLKNS